VGRPRIVERLAARSAPGSTPGCAACTLAIPNPDHGAMDESPERASQIWPVLVFAARNRQTLTYEQLAQLIGVVPPPTLGPLLEPIHRYCKANGLPPLTALGVSSNSGLPGTRFTAAADVPAAEEQVYTFEWSAAATSSTRPTWLRGWRSGLAMANERQTSTLTRSLRIL
jgi:hypothetical protein